VPFFRIVHPCAGGCFVFGRGIPESSVAFSDLRLMTLVRASRLELARPVVAGSWIPDWTAAADKAQGLVILLCTPCTN